MAEDQKHDQEDFKPKGTIALLLLYVVVLITLWGSVYLTLLARGAT